MVAVNYLEVIVAHEKVAFFTNTAVGAGILSLQGEILKEGLLGQTYHKKSAAVIKGMCAVEDVVGIAVLGKIELF